MPYTDPLLPLILSVKRSRFRMDDPTADHANREFVGKRPSILERDRYKCRFCGFKAKKWQEVHHVNNDHQDNSDINLVTACPLCHLVHHVGFAGMRQAAQLIYIDPEVKVSQRDLNQLVRALWIAERHKS